MFVIINLEELQPDSMGNECLIPKDRRPSYIHENRESAESELLRLASTHSGKFVLFESTHTARQTTALVPTKVWALEPITH